MKPRTDDRTSIDMQFELALKHFWTGEYAQATAALDKIRTDEKLPAAIRDRVRTLLNVCSIRLEKNGDPSTAEEYYVAGIWHLNAGRHKESIEHLRNACSREQQNDAYFFSLACAYATAGKRKEAFDALNEAIKKNPENRIFARNARELARLGREDDAVAGLLYG